MPVEIIGPPGIGKSTLYDAVCRSWTPHCRWTYQEKLLGNMNFKTGSLKSVLYAMYTRLTQRSGKSRESIDHGMRFIQQHAQLAEFIWKHITNPLRFPPEKQAERFRALYLLFRDFMRYQAILEAGQKFPCIIQEGFLQKSYLLQVPENELPEWIDQYLQLAPRPDLVFSMDIKDPLPIAVRLESREKWLSAHAGLDRNGLITETRKWQKILAVLQQQLKRQQIHLELLDGLKPVAENTVIIKNHLEALV